MTPRSPLEELAEIEREVARECTEIEKLCQALDADPDWALDQIRTGSLPPLLALAARLAAARGAIEANGKCGCRRGWHRFEEECQAQEPGAKIADCKCPCCGAELSVEHGDDEGEIAVVGKARGAGPTEER